MPKRPNYHPTRDPYNPQNLDVTNSASDLDFRLAYIMSNRPDDPKVRVAVQEILNMNLDARTALLGFVPIDMMQAGVLPEQVRGMEELLDEEIVRKLSWLLAQRLDTPTKVQTILAQVQRLAQYLHGGNDVEEAQHGNLKELIDLSLEEPAGHIKLHPVLLQNLKMKDLLPRSSPAIKDTGSSASGTIVTKDVKRNGNSSKPIVKNSLRSRIKLFMKGTDTIASLSLEEAKLVFKKPKYLSAWRNMHEAILLVSGQKRQRACDVERKINELWNTRSADIDTEWSVFWSDLINHRKTVEELVRGAPQTATPAVDDTSSNLTSTSCPLSDDIGKGLMSHEGGEHGLTTVFLSELQNLQEPAPTNDEYRQHNSSSVITAGDTISITTVSPEDVEPFADAKDRPFDTAVNGFYSSCSRLDSHSSFEEDIPCNLSSSESFELVDIASHGSFEAESDGGSRQGGFPAWQRDPFQKKERSSMLSITEDKSLRNNRHTPVTSILAPNGERHELAKALLERAETDTHLWGYLTDSGSISLSEGIVLEKIFPPGIKYPSRKAESRLKDLIIKFPRAFRELAQCHFVFRTLANGRTPCVDCLCSFPHQNEALIATYGDVAESIVNALRARGGPEKALELHADERYFDVYGDSLSEKLAIVLQKSKRVHLVKHFVEMFLRPLVLENRKVFPDLKNTTLVKEWERLTGFQW